MWTIFKMFIEFDIVLLLFYVFWPQGDLSFLIRDQTCTPYIGRWSLNHWIARSGSCSVVSYSLRPHELQPARLLCPWNSPGQDTGVGSHSLLQGIFPTQGLNPCHPHWRQILYHLSHRSDQISRSVVSDSLRPHESPHARPPCPSPTPGVRGCP